MLIVCGGERAIGGQQVEVSKDQSTEANNLIFKAGWSEMKSVIVYTLIYAGN